jgi:hypothetical protein
MNQPVTNGGGMQGRPMPISQVPQNIQDLWANGGNSPFGGTQVQMKPGGMGPGGQDPMYGGAGTGPSYGGGPKGSPDVNYGSPVQRGPGAPPVGTGPGSMGKPQQPGGSQRPGGGMQGAPQDGGMSQLPPQYQQAYNDLQGQGGQDPNQMNTWRQKLMQMQKQGPMNNQYYGAF